MIDQSRRPLQPAFKGPIPAFNGQIAESAYWYPNELAVTVHAPAPPTLEQLKSLSSQLKRVLSPVGMSVVPFYAGGQRLTRAGAKPGFAEAKEQSPAEQQYVRIETEVGSNPVKAWVEKELEEAWQRERVRRPHRFPGVHVFGSGPAGVAVIFYALVTHHRHRDQRRDPVQVAVNSINQHLLQYHSGVSSLRVLAAMPNWLTFPLGAGHTPGTGPGAPPIWSPDAFPPSGAWAFKQQAFSALVQQDVQAPQGDVTVIILDTTPGDAKEIIARAFSLTDYGNNALLQQLVGDLQTHKMLIDAQTYAHLLPSTHFGAGQDDLGRPFGYDMADHGFFIAGIIRSIVPQAAMKLICTQNRYGVGDMNIFLDALDEVGQRQDTGQMVLNLSLGVLPALEELHSIWFGSTCCCEAPPFAEALRTLEQLHLGLRVAIRSLIEQGVVIVAAAGNDSLGKNPPLGPRYPARYEDVLGVAAVNRKGDAAAYSNQANADYWGSGIATYGGEEPNDDSDTLAWYLGQSPAPQPAPSPPDAVHSLYLNSTYPPLNADDQVSPGDPDYINKSGWAWWSGTSFATAVASGMAAHYILAGYRGKHVIQQLLSDLETAPYCERLQAPILEVVEE